jgi:two-component system chemotaxis sensor kinase CheA
MSTDSSELIEQFAIETQEHLDAIEPILLQAEWTPPDKPAIGALFRAFHSIKGLSRLIELRGLENLANHAESLLGEVRAERQPLDSKVLALLLEALDGIRLLREQGIVNGIDSPPPQELIAALDAATRGSAGGPVAPAAAQAPVAEAALHDDHDTLVYFAEILAECLPNLAVLAGGEGDAEQAADDLDVLMVAAERLQLNGLQGRLARLGEASGPARIPLLAAVLADARRFGKLTGLDVGADTALADAAAPLRRAMAEAAGALADGIASDPATTLCRAERLVVLAAAGLEDGGIAVLVLQSLGKAEVQAPAVAALRLLATTFANDGAAAPDLLSMAAEHLRDALLVGRTFPAPLRKVLEDRGLDVELLGEPDAASLVQLASLLEGGQRKLVAVTLSLPPKNDRPGLLRRLGRLFQPALAQASAPTGIEAVVMLMVTSRTTAGLKSDILGAYTDAVFVDVHEFDGQVFEHPWAPVRSAVAGSGGVADNQVRVPVEILDRLFGRIGEFFGISSALNVLMVDSQVPLVLHRLADHLASTAPELLPSIELLQRQQSDLSQIEAEVHRLVSLVHEATLGLRVIPLDVVFNRFPRMIREISKAQGKIIRFEARAEGIKVDKGMTELLADPLMHMLRNAIDHGIESPDERVALNKPKVASIRLSAIQNGNRITVEIADDGRGVDAERVRRRAVAQGLITEVESQKLSKDQIYRFIFAAGFSTADQVTETSGRGVGMDVALINVSRLGGRIDIQTIPGQGTTFRLDMPLSAAMQTVLLAETRVQTVAFPERMVVEAATVPKSAVQYVNGQRAILMHDRFLPLFRLADLLHLPEGPSEQSGEELAIVVVTSKRFRYGVEVERILRRHEMLIRETHPRIAQLPGIGGVSTLGTDRIVLVVDQDGLTDLARGAIVPGMRAVPRAAE